MKEKKCIDCNSFFTPINRGATKAKRCQKCQEKYRKEYQEKYQEKYQPEWKEENPEYHSIYWKDINTNSHQSKFYQYAKFVETLSDDELRALKYKYLKELWNESSFHSGKAREFRTYIKIIDTEYQRRNGDRVISIPDEYRKDLERIEILEKDGVPDE